MELTQKIIDFAKGTDSPFILFDLDILAENYYKLKNNINKSEIYYAVKANSHRRIVQRLVELGSSFDIASVGELDLVMEFGCTPDRISFGNPIKKIKDIAYAYSKGIRLFVADEFVEVEKIAEAAPGSKVFVRIEASDTDSDWPLTKKFGTNIDKAKDVLRKANELGLKPYGVSFHVGSQCYDKYSWKKALLEVKDIFDTMRDEGIVLEFINTGGGMPVKHVRHVPTIEEICKVINDTVDEYFSDYDNIKVVAEPGRSMVGNTAVLCSEVVLRSHKEKNEWVYIDVGVFHGLMETIEGFRYELAFPDCKGKEELFTLSGPTCDSVDTIYNDVNLPNDIKIGDKVFFLNAGAYTIGYATHFNGIVPPKIYFKDEVLK